MKCNQCGYNEDNNKDKFIGIFIKGHQLFTTNNDICGLYGCPKCNNIQFTIDEDYILKRKENYKKKVKTIE